MLIRLIINFSNTSIDLYTEKHILFLNGYKTNNKIIINVNMRCQYNYLYIIDNIRIYLLIRLLIKRYLLYEFMVIFRCSIQVLYFTFMSLPLDMG